MQREAEENLPKLSDKEGIIVKMRDVNSMQSWSFKYKLSLASLFYLLKKNEINIFRKPIF